MQTRSSNSPPQSVTGNSQRGRPQPAPQPAVESTPTAPAATVNNKHGQWTTGEERELIDFLSDHKSEAGDGSNFKSTTWTQAAAHMSALHVNVRYSASQCSGKWGRVRQYLPLQHLPLTGCTTA
jgi:hypothetical protein